MPRRRNGRRRLPSNPVYRAIQAAGGPSAVCKALATSLATLARWRRAGRVTDASAALTWAGGLHPDDDAAAYRLACQLAGLRPRRR